MPRAFSIVAAAVLLATGLAFAGSPHAGAAAPESGNSGQLKRAYTQVRIGMPFSRVATLGFGTAKVERLSKTALMEHFMPKDKTAFNALDPALKNCYRGSEDCTAYVFDIYSDEMVLLIQGGRVTWKTMFKSMVV
jgi:hypothetical protein